MPSTSTIIEQQLKVAMRESVLSASSALSGMKTRDHDKKLDVSIKAEMTVFESSGKRGRNLGQVPPTSVEAERAFSAAGILCTKLHNHLQDKMLDTLCLLRAHYARKN